MTLMIVFLTLFDGGLRFRFSKSAIQSTISKRFPCLVLLGKRKFGSLNLPNVQRAPLGLGG